jgi:hypothetical protein
MGEHDVVAHRGSRRMSTFLLALIVVIAPAVLAGACVLAARRFLHDKVREGHNDVLVPIFLTAGTIYAVMLGFLVVVVWEAYGDAKENVAIEAASLTTMYRLTAGMDAAEMPKMREHIRAYTEAVIEKEWEIQAETGGAASEARHEITGMAREFSTMDAATRDTAINRQFLAEYSVVAAARDKRRLEAGEDVPWILWLGLVGGATIVIAMSWILYMDLWWPHVVMSGVLALMIGILLFITVVLGKPFQGALALEAGPFEHALSVYKAVDGGD